MSSASNADQPPQKDNHQLPLSLLSLPEEIVLSCLARIPRSYYLNLSLVCKPLKSLVSSPELIRLRSLLHNKSLYIGFCKGDDARTYHWHTLRPIEKTATTIEYRLVPIPYPSHPWMYCSSTVSIGSEIYFIRRFFEYPSELWILDTRSGKFTQGPSMKVKLECEAVGVIDGKIHVIGVIRFAGCDEKIQVEVFDQEPKIWKSAGQEKVRPRPWHHQYIASMEGKIYMVERGRTTVYNPKESEGERMVHMVSERLVENNQKEGIRKESVREQVFGVCVVENILYACYHESGLMWFDTKLNVWKRLVDRDMKEAYCFRLQAMAEHEGKLVLFQFFDHDNYRKITSVKMFLIALDRVGERIRGKIEWSGIVATLPYSPYSYFSKYWHCLVASD